MAKKTFLDFEHPIAELEGKIEELRYVQTESAVDISEEIGQLAKKSQQLTKDIYSDLTPWQITKIARHPERPYTLDYVNELFTDFVELHGDRHFADDLSIVGGLARFNGSACMVLGHQKGRDTKERGLRKLSLAVAIAAVLALVVMASVFAAPAGAATGTIVYSESGVSPAYPRVVRTADSNLLAVFGRNQISPRVELPYEFYRSTDSGTSWSLLATLTDYHGLDVTRLTAPTLFVLPQTEGAYAAGTVFVAFDYLSSSTTVGGVQIFRSTDNGATWTWHSQTAFNKYQAVWEPEFTVDSTGRPNSATGWCTR